MIYKAQNNVINVFDNYSSIKSEVKCKIIYGKRIKILTSKQRFHRLPIAL